MQQPNNIQNVNRYSYVLNNPLNKTDPSGYFFQMLVVWAVQYVAAAAATSAIGTALSVALTAYQYYGYAQMAIGAVKAIEGGGTAMANFAGGMAKGYAKGAVFNAVMAGAAYLASGAGQQGVDSENAAKTVDNKQGSTSTDGHSSPAPDGTMVTGAGSKSSFGKNSVPSKDVLGTEAQDIKAKEILSGYGDSAQEESVVIMRDGTSIAPSSCSNNGCSFSGVDMNKVDFVAHSHVEGMHENADIAKLLTAKRELPGPGDHAFPVRAGAPNYFRTPTGEIKVLEFTDSNWRVRTVDGASIGNIESWHPRDADISSSEIRKVLKGRR